MKDALEDILRNSDGKDNVIYYFKDQKKKIALPFNMSINAGKETADKLIQLMGEENIRITY